MTKLLLLIAFNLLLLIHVNAQSKSDKQRDNLVGLVHSVRTETALVICKSGECIEKDRVEHLTDKYDVNGRVIGNRNRFVISDPISRMLNYPFDESIPEIEEPMFNEEGIFLYKNVYRFSNTEKREGWIIFRADGSILRRSTYRFNKQGRLIESKSYKDDGVLTSWNETTYDKNGNEVEQFSKNVDGSLIFRGIYTYEFDFTGNWVKQNIFTVINNGELVLEPYAVKYRTITYY
jgi:hypothetical protein